MDATWSIYAFTDALSRPTRATAVRSTRSEADTNVLVEELSSDAEATAGIDAIKIHTPAMTTIARGPLTARTVSRSGAEDRLRQERADNVLAGVNDLGDLEVDDEAAK